MYRPFHLEFIPRMVDPCKECGCVCSTCDNNNSLHLHHEVEELRSKLTKSNNHIAHMEHEFAESKDYAEQEITKLQDELLKLRDRYERLFESHKKLQKLNHNLEDKLLSNVNKSETEKTSLQKDCASASAKLLDAKVTICELEEECERYRNDCNVAVQLLHCKPSNFVAHKLNTLPLDLQERVKTHLTQKEISDLEDASTDTAPQETKMIRVPMPTFPPTAMVYSVNKSASTKTSNSVTESTIEKLETVPTGVIATVLTQQTPKRKPRRIYVCNKCRTDIMFMDMETQTPPSQPDVSSQLSSWHSHRAHPSAYHTSHPGVHRPRLNSTETEI